MKFLHNVHHLSHDLCHLSFVRCHGSLVFLFYFLFIYFLLVGGGSVIMGPTLSRFQKLNVTNDSY